MNHLRVENSSHCFDYIKVRVTERYGEILCARENVMASVGICELYKPLSLFSEYEVQYFGA